LANLVRFGLALRAGDVGLGVAFGFSDFLRGLRLRLGQLVVGAFGVLDGLRLGGDGVRNHLRDARCADEAELLDADADGRDLLLDERFHLVRNCAFCSP
jgi:hypothetical protein